MNPKLTPRTDIDGAHQQGVFVRSGSKLGRSFYEYKRIYFVVVCGLLTAMAMNSSSEYWSNYAHAGQELPLWLNVGLISLIVVGLVFMVKSHPYVQFAYNCFIKPFLKSTTSGINANEHQARLEQFYSGQAQIYDETRKRLLKGRSTMLKLCAAQLRQVYPCQIPFVNGDRFGISNYNASPSLSPTFLSCAGKRFAWVDVGGGTGENIERMNQFFPISNFERVYLVDITPSLCDIARKRFQRLGWSNVKVVCVDASKFKIPKEDGDDLDIALVTMSYSLTMIESFYPVIDQLQKLLAPTGIFGVADFYCPTKRSADPTRQISWLMRWFWAIWFDLDNVYLSPGRREYLEHKFKTVKQISKMNPFIKPFVKIPYYVWIGAQKGLL